jgi:hypothetical protein
MPDAPDNAKHNIPLMGDSKIATGDVAGHFGQMIK